MVTLAVGIVIGAYGFPGPEAGGDAGVVPPERWAREAELRPMDGAAAGVAATPTAWPLSVYVSGAVVAARVVQVPPGSLVADVLAASGGPLADADLDALNLAAPVSDNQHVVVPTIRPTADAARATASTGSFEGAIVPIDINAASVEEFDSLPEIGATRAEAIVAYREANGPFRRIEDILLVPGIGPAIFERIAPLITVGP
jgi:competence protein ComEA